MDISIVIPALNEAEQIRSTLESTRGPERIERIVVDGGSRDRTREIAAAAGADQVLETAPGRALQMNRGARCASGELLLFLHADTRLPGGFDTHVRGILSKRRVSAGAFRLGIDSDSFSTRVIQAAANWRSERLQLPYGDQGLFLRADTFHEIGGFPELAILEDYLMARLLRRRGRIVVARAAVLTSGRRWTRLGPWRTTLVNQMMIAGYTLGVDPTRLARWYGRPPTPGA